MVMCDYRNCGMQATTNGFVQLKEIDMKTGVKFMDVNACDKHKEENGFFAYIQEKDNE